MHLTEIGFDGAPRFIGMDAQRREVLSYIPGTAVTPPYPDWALSDEALVRVAELVRAYHQAVRTFNPTTYACRRRPLNHPSGSWLPARELDEWILGPPHGLVYLPDRVVDGNLRHPLLGRGHRNRDSYGGGHGA